MKTRHVLIAFVGAVILSLLFIALSVVHSIRTSLDIEQVIHTSTLDFA